MPNRSHAPHFLDGGGDMGARMRAHDWTASPLGDPSTWPQSLRSVVGLLVESKFPMFVAWGEELGFLYNDAYVEILGDKHPAALGMRFADVWADAWADLRPLVDASLAGKASYFKDWPLRTTRNGYDEETWFTFSYSPVRDESGRVVGMFCACTETTVEVLHGKRLALEQAEALAIRTAERDRMWETSPDLMLISDAHGVLHRVNPAWTALLGHAAEDSVGRPVRDFVMPDDGSAISVANPLAAAEARPGIVNRCRHRDGSVRWIAWTVAAASDATYATGRDVTADRERAAMLRRYRDIVEATVAPICAFDTDFRLIAFNRAHNDEFRRVNGFETRIGDVFPDLFVPEQRDRMRQLMGRALSGEHFTVRGEFGRPEYGVPCWEIAYTPLRDESGAVVGAFHHATDISETLLAEAKLDEAQDALRQSQKMDAMGQLTGGVAHDFNNLLTPIIGSLDLLTRHGVGTDRERRLVEAALRSAERAKTLVQRLLAFARRQPLEPAPVDMDRLLNGMAALLGSTLGPNIALEVDLAHGLPAASADFNQLEMALLNLAVNARDAMPDGGRLTISAKRGNATGEHPSGLPLGPCIQLSVADTGSGMDAETLRRAVEPFFSTKGIGKGTGLGLSMVHGLASQLGGGLTIQSEVGRGTTIALWLPISTDAVPAAGSSPARPLSRHRGTALVVDDEELVRMVTADMLGDLGFDVIEADSAEKALEVIGSGPMPDVLVTDHRMPGMSGVELVHAARRVHPALPALLLSGNPDVDGLSPHLPRLSKPFRDVDLAASLSALMPGDRL